jgi:hypothetical protein
MNPIFIVIFIALAVFGSVYMLKPSPRQQRLAELRLEAIKLGLQVKLETFKTDSKKMGVRDDVTATRYERFNPAVKSGALFVRRVGSKKVWQRVGVGTVLLSVQILKKCLRYCRPSVMMFR